MNRQLLWTFALMLAASLAIWGYNGFPAVSPARLGLAAAFLVIASFMVWLRWDYAPRIGRERRKQRIDQTKGS